MKKSKMRTRYEVRFDKHNLGDWIFLERRGRRPQVLMRKFNKGNLVAFAADLLTGWGNREGLRSELFIFGRDGQIKDRRTYPLASDPRRTPG